MGLVWAQLTFLTPTRSLWTLYQDEVNHRNVGSPLSYPCDRQPAPKRLRRSVIPPLKMGSGGGEAYDNLELAHLTRTRDREAYSEWVKFVQNETMISRSPNCVD